MTRGGEAAGGSDIVTGKRHKKRDSRVRLLKGNGKLAFVSLPLVRAARSRAASETGAIRALAAVFDMSGHR